MATSEAVFLKGKSAIIIAMQKIIFKTLIIFILFIRFSKDVFGEDLDNLENLGRVYFDSNNPALQEFWILGRYHGQHHWSEASSGESESYETRRHRVGFQAKMYDKFTLHAQMVSGSDFKPFYNGFTELWGQFAFSSELALTVGQQKHRFTHDRNVSSRYLNYLERSLVTNMFNADYTPAITLQGKKGKIFYYTGLFSNATGQNMEKAFTNFNSGYSALGTVYYDLGNFLNLDSSILNLSYIHSNANNKATNLNTFDDGVAFAGIFAKDSRSFVAEVTSGTREQGGNILGINLQPGIFLTNKLQAVSRYQLATSNSEEGLKSQKRYERESGLTTGDLYQAGYFGLNYYIAKHRLKLMQGIEYSTIGGEEAWTASIMFRFYFGPHSGGAFPMNQTLTGFFEHD